MDLQTNQVVIRGPSSSAVQVALDRINGILAAIHQDLINPVTPNPVKEARIDDGPIPGYVRPGKHDYKISSAVNMETNGFDYRIPKRVEPKEQVWQSVAVKRVETVEAPRNTQSQPVASNLDMGGFAAIAEQDNEKKKKKKKKKNKISVE